MENQKSNKSNKKTIWLIIVILVVAAIAINVFLASSSDDRATPGTGVPADEFESPDPTDGEQVTDSQDSQSADQQLEADPESQDADSISANVGSLMATGQQLEADLDAAIAAGCGDDLGAFNQTVADLLVRFGAYQESLLSTFPGDPGQISGETAEQLIQLQAMSESVQTKNESLADISNTCNSQG